MRPVARSDMDCPLHRKAMSKVCHKCPLWMQLRGKDPQSGKELNDEWLCALAVTPTMMMQVIAELRSNVAASQKVGTSIDDFHTNMAKMQIASLQTLREASNVYDNTRKKTSDGGRSPKPNLIGPAAGQRDEPTEGHSGGAAGEPRKDEYNSRAYARRVESLKRRQDHWRSED